MKRYVGKEGGWFKTGTEVLLVEDCEQAGGLFRGTRISEGPPELHDVGEEYVDEEVCGWHEVELMSKGQNPYKRTLDNHDFMEKDHISRFLRNHKTGIDNLGRQGLAQIVEKYDNPRVIDAACGTCVNWDVFKLRGTKCEYVGVDRTEGLLSHAQELYGDEIELVQGYVQALPFNDDSADIVVLRHILEHLQEGYEDVIREGLRVASKELVIVFFLDPSNAPQDDISESDPDENGCTYFWNTYSYPKLMEFLNGFGYQVKLHVIPTPGAAHQDTIVRIIK